MELASAIIGILGVAAAILFGALAFRRGQKADDKVESERLTRIESNVDYIKTTVDEIKNDQRDQRDEIGDISQRLTRVEESARQAHKRIDHLEKTA